MDFIMFHGTEKELGEKVKKWLGKIATDQAYAGSSKSGISLISCAQSQEGGFITLSIFYVLK